MQGRLSVSQPSTLFPILSTSTIYLRGEGVSDCCQVPLRVYLWPRSKLLDFPCHKESSPLPITFTWCENASTVFIRNWSVFLKLRQYSCLTLFRPSEEVFFNGPSFEWPNAATLVPATILLTVFPPWFHLMQAVCPTQIGLRTLRFSKSSLGIGYSRNRQHLGRSAASRHSSNCGRKFWCSQFQKMIFRETRMRSWMLPHYFGPRPKQWMQCLPCHERYNWLLFRL